MENDLLHNWQKKSDDHQKKYKQFLQRADKNKVLKLLVILIAWIVLPAAKIILPGLKRRILNASLSI
jgi:hypothetical protein